MCSYFENLKCFSDSHSGASTEHFAKTAHKVSKSECWGQFSPSKIIGGGGGGGRGTTSISYSAKVCSLVELTGCSYFRFINRHFNIPFLATSLRLNAVTL